MQTDRIQGSRDDLRIERDHTCCQRREHKDPDLRRFFTEYFHDFPLLNPIQRPLLPVNTEKSDNKSSGEHVVGRTD